MKTKIFIDGKEGTTGLRIYDRIKERVDLELLSISDEDRKDPIKRQELINKSDITFLCLPDAASRESVSLVQNENTKIIDASTAFRTDDAFVYGFPELDDALFNKIKNSKRVAVPGCHASGFIAIVYPLIKLGILPKDYPLTCNSISGYSGAGKKAIALYETTNDPLILAPRQYAMSQEHKHLPEMKYITGIAEKPIFNPIICPYYSGMEVSVGLYLNKLNKKLTVKELHNIYKEYYKTKMVDVMLFLASGNESGFLSSVSMSGYDNMQIYVSGNDERVLITALYDNLGKGASGAAIECMNIMLGLNPEYGLKLKDGEL